MKKIYRLIILLLLVLGCMSEGKNVIDTIEVKGSIEGLRKGTLYLQKIQDSILIDLDSIVLKGSPEFSLNKSFMFSVRCLKKKSLCAPNDKDAIGLFKSSSGSLSECHPIQSFPFR